MENIVSGRSTLSCGIAIVWDLYNGAVPVDWAYHIKKFIRKPIHHIKESLYHQSESSGILCKDFAAVIFSDKDNARGDSLMRYLQDEKLGTVHKQVLGSNPNTKNIIALYTWILPEAKDMAKWLEEHP